MAINWQTTGTTAENTAANAERARIWRLLTAQGKHQEAYDSLQPGYVDPVQVASAAPAQGLLSSLGSADARSLQGLLSRFRQEEEARQFADVGNQGDGSGDAPEEWEGWANMSDAELQSLAESGGTLGKGMTSGQRTALHALPLGTAAQGTMGLLNWISGAAARSRWKDRQNLSNPQTVGTFNPIKFITNLFGGGGEDDDGTTTTTGGGVQSFGGNDFLNTYAGKGDFVEEAMFEERAMEKAQNDFRENPEMFRETDPALNNEIRDNDIRSAFEELRSRG